MQKGTAMPHSIFGWSLPPGCHTLPGEEPEPVQPRCEHCQAYLPWKPDAEQTWESKQHCDGKTISVEWGRVSECGQETDHEPHDEVMYAGVTQTWTCKRCGETTSVTL
jgi:hypothetical protein